MGNTKRKSVKKDKPRTKTSRKIQSEKTAPKSKVIDRDLKPNKEKWKAKKGPGKIEKNKTHANPKKKSQKKDNFKSASVEDRLAYYKKKYGEDFSIAGQKGAPAIKKTEKKAKRKKKFIKKIISFFRK